MAKLIMMRGLPASGKSTEAAKIMKDTGNCVRVNRDLLREMLHFNKWTGKNEKLTVTAEKTVATLMLAAGYNVIVDDCNLSKSNEDMWRERARDIGGIKFEVRDIKTSVLECMERDSERDKKVGDHVIYKMAMQHGLLNIEDPIIICDIDGTLADLTHRRHHVLGEKKDWDSFFEAMDTDPLRQSTKDILDSDEMDDCTMVIVSGRPEKYRERTEDWLERHGLDGYPLIMREDHDKREDTIVKKEIFDKYLSRYKIKCVIDDRPSVIRMWRDNGMEVIDVGDGVEF